MYTLTYKMLDVCEHDDHEHVKYDEHVVVLVYEHDGVCEKHDVWMVFFDFASLNTWLLI